MVCLGLEPGAAGWKAQTNHCAMAAPQGLEYFYNRKTIFDESTKTPKRK